MKFLVKDEYYNLDNEDVILHSSYRIVESDSPKKAVFCGFYDNVHTKFNKDSWQQKFIDGKVGCGTTEVYLLDNNSTVGKNLVLDMV